MPTKLCIMCGVAPAYETLRRAYSYCKDCDSARKKANYLKNSQTARAKERARKQAMKVDDRPCTRCGGDRTGRTDRYCRTCRNSYNREYYQRPDKRERVLENQRRRYYDPATRERELALRRRYREESKRAAIDAYGGKCACCGESEIDFLAIDHIYGGGKEHRQQASSVGNSFYRWLRREGYPQGDLRVLCHNCNQALGFYGRCPHGNLPPQPIKPQLPELSP